ncbi:MAG: MBG domain-containing protein [Chloroflexota bacterium]
MNIKTLTNRSLVLFLTMLLAVMPLTRVAAATTAEIVPTGNGVYTGWTNDYTTIDEGSGSAICHNGDYIHSSTGAVRESAVISLATVPDGATITNIDVLVKDRSDTVDGGTYATFIRFNGIDSANSATHTATGTTGSCLGSYTDAFDITDTTKSGITTLEIGVVKINSGGATNNRVRIGILSAVINYTISVSGPKNGGTGSDDAGIGTIAWTNPGNIVSNNNSYAMANLTVGTTSHYLQATNYGFNIPSGSTISGIETKIGRLGTDGLGSDVRDNIVSLIKGGVVTGENKAAVTTDWPSAETAATYGGITDLWGTTWTAEDINSSNFGLALAVRSSVGTREAHVDYMQITVTYQLSSTTTTVDCGSGVPIIDYEDSITCVATVTRSAGTNTPAGSVNWSTDGSGGFTTSPCTLSGAGASATCSVTYTPSSVGSGTHLIAATYAGNSNFLTSSGNQAVTVNKSTPTLSITNSPVVYNGSPQAATVTSSVAGTVSNVKYDTSATQPTDAGTYAVTADFTPTDTANYDSLTDASAGNFVISPKALTGSITADNKVYDGSDSATIATRSLTGVVAPDDVSYSGGTATFNNKHVGTGKTVSATGLSLSGADLGNYTVNSSATTTANITQRPISVTAATNTKTYDGTTNSTGTPTITTGALQGSDSATWTQTFDNKNVGAGKTITPAGSVSDGNSGGNYAISFFDVFNGEITAKTLTVTADDKAITVGNPDPAFTYSISGFVNPDTFITSPTCSVLVAHSTAGNYPIICSGGDAGTNYSINNVDGTLTVHVKITLTVTADNQTITYGDADPASSFYTFTYGPFDGGDTSAVIDTAPTCTATGPFTHAGSPYPITCSGGVDDKYEFSYTSGSLSVDELAIAVTADGKTKVYGASDPALTYGNSPALVGSDSFSGSLSRDTGENVDTYAINQGTLSLSANYILNYTSANLSITKAPLTVTANNKTKVSGTPDPAFTFDYTGFVNSETLAVIDTPPTCGVTGAHGIPGDYPIVCSGGLDNNYAFTSYVNGTLTVTQPAPMTLITNHINDGFIVESTETSNVGGTVNSTAATFSLGDDNLDRQYRGILHFNTSGLPDTAVVTSATLKIKRQGVIGTNPFTILGALRVDLRKPYFGTTIGLTGNDFQATATKVSTALFNTIPAGGWYSAALNGAGKLNINRTGTTQFRLRFTTDDNNDNGFDYMKFYSGSAGAANRPQLIIQYYVP